MCTAQIPPPGIAPKPTPIIIPNVKGAIVLDGELNESQWQSAKVFSLIYITRPHENTAPPVTTEVRVFEDDRTLYIGFIAHDPNPQNIRAYYRDRDKIWSDDLVGLKLDTFNDSRLAYQFFSNPLGVQADSIQNEMTGRESDSWNGVWDAVGQITETGYQVEMAIPLRILNFREGTENKIWGAEFVRFYPREERLRISNIPTNRNNACSLCQLGDVSGFKAASQGRNFAVIPTVVASKSRERELTESNQWNDFNNQEIGLDLTWGVTPEVSLQATLNPDFSQVESDIAQLSINNTNALFFGERRPFFLENIDYFSSNFNLVHTRNINAPDYGLKVTGRVDKHSLGLFMADDQTTTFLVPGNLGSDVAELSEKSNNLALRYRFDYSPTISFGVVSTARESDSYHNYVVALDTKYQITEQDTFRVQLVSSETQYPFGLSDKFSDEAQIRLSNKNAFRGNAFKLNYRHNQRDWSVRADHIRNSRDFRADLGFERAIDVTKTVVGGEYRWFNENSWWNRIAVFGDWDTTHSQAGELLEKEAEIHASIRARYQTYMEFTLQTRERVGLRQDSSRLQIENNTTLFQEDSASLYFDMRPSSALYFSFYGQYGDQIDFTNNRLGKQLNLRPRMNLSIGKHLQFNVRHTYRTLDVQGSKLFTANLTDARLTYQFNQRQFIRFIFLYSDIERNLDNYTVNTNDILSVERGLGTQLLYSYKLNPLTKLFIGYSDNSIQNDNVQARTVSEQSIFLKFSYAWLN